MVPISAAIQKKMKTYLEYPPRKMQSMGYTGPITLSKYQMFKSIRDDLKKEGIHLPMPTGN
jgi:arylsulfatase